MTRIQLFKEKIYCPEVYVHHKIFGYGRVVNNVGNQMSIEFLYDTGVKIINYDFFENFKTKNRVIDDLKQEITTHFFGEKYIVLDNKAGHIIDINKDNVIVDFWDGNIFNFDYSYKKDIKIRFDSKLEYLEFDFRVITEAEYYKIISDEKEKLVIALKKSNEYLDYKSDNLIDDIDLMPHQKKGVYLADEYDKYAFFYDTGTGKTLMALDIMAKKYKEEKAKFLVIAPKVLIKNAWLDDATFVKNLKLFPIRKDVSMITYLELYNRWNDEDGYFTGNEYLIEFDSNGELKTKLTPEAQDELVSDLEFRAHHYIINIESLKNLDIDELISKYKINGFILDESSIIKNYYSESAKFIRKLSEKVKYAYLLSGKPAPNSEREYFSQMKVVDPTTFYMSFEKFTDDFFILKHFKYKLKKELKEKFADMIHNRSLIISKEDCLELPKLITHRKNINLYPETKRIHDEVAHKIATTFIVEDKEKIKISHFSVLAKLIKLRQITSGFIIDDIGNVKQISKPEKVEKIIALDKILDEIGREKQVIIWCNFTYEINLIKKYLWNRGESYAITSGDPKIDNDLSVYKFKHGIVKYLIANLKTLKYGVTLTNSSNAIFFSMSYSFEDFYQASARIHRKGATVNCNIYKLVAHDTIDTMIDECITNKQSNAKMFEKLIKKYSRYDGKVIDQLIEENSINIENTIEKYDGLEKKNL